MKKFLLLCTTAIILLGGCAGIRISNLPSHHVVTDSGIETHNVTTKIDGVITEEIITTDKWDRKQTDNRPYFSGDYNNRRRYYNGRHYNGR
jgi:hypothetical protein